MADENEQAARSLKQLQRICADKNFLVYPVIAWLEDSASRQRIETK